MDNWNLMRPISLWNLRIKNILKFNFAKDAKHLMKNWSIAHHPKIRYSLRKGTFSVEILTIGPNEFEPEQSQGPLHHKWIRIRASRFLWIIQQLNWTLFAHFNPLRFIGMVTWTRRNVRDLSKGQSVKSKFLFEIVDVDYKGTICLNQFLWLACALSDMKYKEDIRQYLNLVFMSCDH